MKRLDKDEYYLQIAENVALRSTCLDKRVGCVLTNRNGIIVATGYNGAPRGFEHCTDIGFCKKDATGNLADCPSAHAEQNALLYCYPDQVYKCYVTLSPCITCIRMLLNTSCEEVIFRHEHRHPEAKRLWCEVHRASTWRSI